MAPNNAYRFHPRKLNDTENTDPRNNTTRLTRDAGILPPVSAQTAYACVDVMRSSSRDTREDVAPGTTTALREKGARIREQDRQCKYNVTLRRVHETTVAVEKQ